MDDEARSGITVGFLVQIVMSALVAALLAASGFMGGKLFTMSSDISALSRDVEHDERDLKTTSERLDKAIEMQSDLAAVRTEVQGMEREVRALTDRLDGFLDPPPHAGIK